MILLHATKLYQNDQVTAYWDVPVYADHTEMQANRVDARIVDKEREIVTLLEMSCPWIEHRKQKDEEKTRKYALLRWEIKKQFPGYRIAQIKGGFYLNAIFPPLDMALMEISRSRFKQSKTSTLIP